MKVHGKLPAKSLIFMAVQFRKHGCVHIQIEPRVLEVKKNHSSYVKKTSLIKLH